MLVHNTDDGCEEFLNELEELRRKGPAAWTKDASHLITKRRDELQKLKEKGKASKEQLDQLIDLANGKYNEYIERAADSLSARKRAAELAKMGDDTIPFVSEVGPQTGWLVGRQSSDKLRHWRMDWDPEKGFHVNWLDMTGGPKKKYWLRGAIIIEGGSWDDYINLLKHAFGN